MKFMRKNGGFTLVELIVVIALLAILAGVAVPAYSGYINKANEAADNQLLSAINTSFAAACIENGVDPSTVTAANIAVTNKKIGAVSGVSASTGNPANVPASFANYFTAANPNATFKVFTALVYNPATHNFVGDGTLVKVTYAGSTIYLPQSAIDGLKGSSFGTVGADGLLELVNTVTGTAQLMAGKLDAVFGDAAFQKSAMLALGATTADEFNAKTQAIVQEMMEKNPDMTMNQAIAQMNANAAVLYASQNAVKYTDEQITDLFAGGSASVKDNLKTDGKTADGMAQAALIYGMYTAYANSAEYGNADLQANAEDPLAVLNAMDNDANFKAFVNSEQGKQDMEAFRNSLGIIVDSTENNGDATTDLMVNGFNNDELKGVIGGLMG